MAIWATKTPVITEVKNNPPNLTVGDRIFFTPGQYQISSGTGLTTNIISRVHIQTGVETIADDINPSAVFYEIQEKDIGYRFKFVQIFKGQQTSEQQTFTAPLSSPIYPPVANTRPPVITSDNGPYVGDTFRCNDPGDWQGGASFAFKYQWEADSVAITGATTITFKITAAQVGKKITCRVAVDNIQAVSNQLGPISAEPYCVSPPVLGVFGYYNGYDIAATIPAANWRKTKLTTNGTWLNATVFQREYYIDNQPTGNTSAELILQKSHDRKFIKVKVTATSATNSALTKTIFSNEIGPVLPFPVLKGPPNVGQTLYTENDPLYAGYTMEYQWYSNTGSNGAYVKIAGANSRQYVVQAAMLGKLVQANVIAGLSNGSDKVAWDTDPVLIGAAFPPAGSVVSTSCNGFTLTQQIADGNGGTTTRTVEKSPECGYAPPVNTSLPTVVGEVRADQPLTATNGTWTNSPTTYTYQWKVDGVNIAGATNKTFVPTSAHVGKKISVTVTATNSSASTPATSLQTPAVSTAYPAAGSTIGQYCEDDTLVKKIADGTGGFFETREPVSRECTPPAPPTPINIPFILGKPWVGQNITGDQGNWTGAFVTFTAKWIIYDTNGTPTEQSATLINKQSALLLTSSHLGKTLEFSVTGTNAWGVETAVSLRFGPIIEQPPPVGTVIYEGCEGFNKILHKSDGEGGYTVEAIPKSPDCGYAPPVNTSPPTIVGIPRPGRVVEATNGTWTNNPTGFGYRWFVDGVLVPNQTAQTFLIADNMVGKKITVEVTAVNASDSATKLSAPVTVLEPFPPYGTQLGKRCEGKTQVLTKADGDGGTYEERVEKSPACGFSPPVNVTPPSIVGEMATGQVVTANPGTWSGFQPITLTYQWYADGELIAGANQQSYEIAEDLVDKRLTVKVTATNEDGTAEATSPPTKRIVKGFPPKGKKLGERCEGQVLMGTFANGKGGSYEVVIEADSLQCNWVTAVPFGTVIETKCVGTTLVEMQANGKRGSFNVYYTKSFQCGYTDEPTNEVDEMIEEYKRSDNYTLRFLSETLGWYRDRMGFTKPITSEVLNSMQANLWAATRAAAFETQEFDACMQFILAVFRENRDGAFGFDMLMRTLDSANSRIYGDQYDAYKGIMNIYTIAAVTPNLRDVKDKINVAEKVSTDIFSPDARGRLIRYFT